MMTIEHGRADGGPMMPKPLGPRPFRLSMTVF